LFTTQDIKYKNLELTIENSNFSFNSLEKGYMFEFKHSFVSTKIKDSYINNNIGYLFEMIQSDSLDMQNS